MNAPTAAATSAGSAPKARRSEAPHSAAVTGRARKPARKERWLRPTDATDVERKRIVVFDIESKDGPTQKMGLTRPFLIDLYDGEKHDHFFNDPRILYYAPWQEQHRIPGGCIDLFCRKVFGWSPSDRTKPPTPESIDTYSSAKCRIYGHNAGRFDMLFLLGWLDMHREFFAYDILGVQAKILQLTVRRLDVPMEWTFLDSVAILPMTLKKAGETFCKSAMRKMKFDLELHETDKRWIEYNAIDDEVLHGALTKFYDLIELRLGGRVGVTAASTAMHLWRRQFQTQWVDRHEHWSAHGACPETCAGCTRVGCDGACHGCLHAFFREGYYGGRTEVFGRTGRNVRYYDLNSSYPAAMRMDMPVGKATEFHKPITEKMGRKLAEKHIGIVEASVFIPPDVAIPPLPMRMDGKLKFPTGYLHGVWGWDELQLLHHPRVGGTIEKIHRSVWIRKKPLFVEFVDTMYSFRQKHKKGCKDKRCDACNPDYDAGLDFIAKLMMNSLYGKTGMNPDRESIVCLPKGQHCKDGRPLTGDPDDCQVWAQPTLVEAPYIVPQVAQHVTTLARVRLFLGMMACLDAGGEVLYTDSVSADRTVVLKDPHDRVRILPVEEAWAKAGAFVDRALDKEFSTPEPGWRALAMDRDGNQGWFPLERIIRHKVSKPMWLVWNKQGQTQVTADHGVMLDAKTSATPKQFLEAGAHFVTLQAPKSERQHERIDLWEFVKDAVWETPFKGRILTRRFECDGDFLFLNGWSRVDKERILVRRYYEPGTPELHAMLRVLGAYLSEGSASIRAVTGVRNLFSIAQKNREWLAPLNDDLKIVFPGYHASLMPTGNGMWCIRSGASALCYFFHALAGIKSNGKRLPAFVYDLSRTDFDVLWNKAVEGDGRVSYTGERDYGTKSQQYAAGLSFALSQHGVEHRLSYRTDKKCYTIGTRPSGTERNRKKTHHVVRRPSVDEYVYDLSVAGAHTFVDGMGRVLLHNTDSVTTTVPIPTGNGLGEWKQEEASVFLSIEALAAKFYRLMAHEPDCANEACEGCLQHFHTPECKRRDKVKPDGSKCKGCSVATHKMKGFPMATQTQDVWDRLVSRAEGPKGEVTFTRLSQHRTILANRWLAPQEIRVTKRLRGEMDKRVWLENGKTRPLFVNRDGIAS